MIGPLKLAMDISERGLVGLTVLFIAAIKGEV